MNDDVRERFFWFHFSVIGVGMIITISRSKIRNKIAVMKYWLENDGLLVSFLLNPHSNADEDWFLFFFFFLARYRIAVRAIVRHVDEEIALRVDIKWGWGLIKIASFFSHFRA